MFARTTRFCRGKHLERLVGVKRLLSFVWNSLREHVVEAFPKAPGLPLDASAYLSAVDEIYGNDAYHSMRRLSWRLTKVLSSKNMPLFFCRFALVDATPVPRNSKAVAISPVSSAGLEKKLRNRFFLKFFEFSHEPGRYPTYSAR